MKIRRETIRRKKSMLLAIFFFLRSINSLVQQRRKIYCSIKKRHKHPVSPISLSIGILFASQVEFETIKQELSDINLRLQPRRQFCLYQSRTATKVIAKMKQVSSIQFFDGSDSTQLQNSTSSIRMHSKLTREVQQFCINARSWHYQNYYLNFASQGENYFESSFSLIISLKYKMQFLWFLYLYLYIYKNCINLQKLHIFMHQIFPKVNQVFSYHLTNFEVIDKLIDSVSLRVQAQELYEKALNKSAQKIIDLKSDHPLYSKIIQSFKSLINQRVSQVRFFKQQIAKEAEQLKEALIPIEQKMKTYLSELKGMQKDLKSSFDTLTKNRNAAEHKLKELDQKFILNEVSVLYKQNMGLRKNSESFFLEQEKITKSLSKDWKMVKKGMTNFQTGAQEHQKKIWQLDIKVEQQFVDFIKKMNVHQISLIRNIQYDIDTMIKKTDIFNWQNTNEFKEQFSNKTIEQFQLSFRDPYRDFKKSILEQGKVIDEKGEVEIDGDKVKMMKQKLGHKNQRKPLLHEIQQKYSIWRNELCVWIQSFRKEGKFKFQLEEFQPLSQSFIQILKCSIKNLDFDAVQKIILYGNSYFTVLGQKNKRNTILDEIKKEKILGDLGFWKFYIFWLIRSNIIECKVVEERDIHIRNSIYTTLLSNSLSMIDWGIEKHSIKNLIAKMAKTFASLTEAQVAQLLKVIETAYENHEKMKKNKKE